MRTVWIRTVCKTAVSLLGVKNQHPSANPSNMCSYIAPGRPGITISPSHQQGHSMVEARTRCRTYRIPTPCYTEHPIPCRDLFHLGRFEMSRPYGPNWNQSVLISPISSYLERRPSRRTRLTPDLSKPGKESRFGGCDRPRVQ